MSIPYVLAVASIKFSFANTELSEDHALVLADLLSMERSSAAHNAGSKIRQQAERLTDQREASEDVELEADERAAMLRALDAVPDEEMEESWREDWRNLRTELRQLGSS
jgi:hypothetical protein